MNVQEIRQVDWHRTGRGADNAIVSLSQAGVDNARHYITNIAASYDDPSQNGDVSLFGLETVNGAKGYVGPLDCSSASVVNLTSDTFTVAGHGLANGDKVVYHANGGTAITGLTSGTLYYVVGVSGNDFQLSATSGGAAINISGTQASLGTEQYILKLGRQWGIGAHLEENFVNPLVCGVNTPVNAQISAIASTQGFINISGYTKG